VLFKVFVHGLRNVMMLSKEIIFLLNYPYKLCACFLGNNAYSNNYGYNWKVLH
jgi:hypothetical protein